MIEKDKRIRIITGNYGSGKTEFALNYAVALAALGHKTALADLDIVNVYFRSREKKEELERLGIRVIGSSIDGNAVDIPAVSAEIYTPVRDKSYQYIIDLGGNEIGTKVMGLLRPELDDDEVDFFMVVNVNRPETDNVVNILRLKEKIESSSKLKITGFINNTNLIRETNIENLLFGEEILKSISKETGISVKYTSYMEALIKKLPEEALGDGFPLKFFMRENWM